MLKIRDILIIVLVSIVTSLFISLITSSIILFLSFSQKDTIYLALLVMVLLLCIVMIIVKSSNLFNNDLENIFKSLKKKEVDKMNSNDSDATATGETEKEINDSVVSDNKDSKTLEDIKKDESLSDVPLENLVNDDKWKIFKTSQQGNDHIKKNPPIPCQDNHCVLEIDDKWGIAVVCDGAGSHKYSHIGSKFVSEYIAKILYDSIIKSQMYANKILLDKSVWTSYCHLLIRQTRGELGKYINDKEKNNLPEDININNVGCTIILTVYSDIGLLIGHIGDGRAGYKDSSGWHSMMEPYNGEYANQTIFINSDFIYKRNKDEKIFVDTLETRVIAQDDISAFLLMSDGCESGLYTTTIYDEIEKKYTYINKPYAPIFESIISTLNNKLKTEGKVEADKEFENIIKNGNDILRDEGDDKTLIFAYKGI